MTRRRKIIFRTKNLDFTHIHKSKKEILCFEKKKKRQRKRKKSLNIFLRINSRHYGMPYIPTPFLSPVGKGDQYLLFLSTITADQEEKIVKRYSRWPTPHGENFLAHCGIIFPKINSIIRQSKFHSKNK